ncbi:MAG: hypothetical protein DSY42_03555 [Aquifex sp.]|nr:MAG: hypothetical protein DSY42_03555 [Aquifex sp.]
MSTLDRYSLKVTFSFFKWKLEQILQYISDTECNRGLMVSVYSDADWDYQHESSLDKDIVWEGTVGELKDLINPSSEPLPYFLTRQSGV